MRKHGICGFLSVALLFMAAMPAAGDMNAPPEPMRAAPASPPQTESSLTGQMAGALAGAFQRFVSPLDGDRCPSIPTCSAYSRQAFARHGFWLGAFLTIDRLLHEADMEDHAPLVQQGDRLRFFDPMENNEFWRSKP